MMSIHEVRDGELREVVPLEQMQSHGIPQKTVLFIDAKDEDEILLKVKNWLDKAKE